MAADSSNTQLVVVGSSAGGVEALQTLVSSLPRDFPAPLLIAQHLDPRRPSHLEEILSRRSALPVATVLDHEALVPGKVFVIPADQHVEISDCHLKLRDHVDGVRPKPSINLLFSSAAEAYGEGLIAVILTGTGSDGAACALQVKKAGGTVVIQNSATASYPSMPQSLAPTSVDFVANIEEMSQLLYALLTGASSLTQASEAKALRDFLAQVHARSGFDFAHYKPATILRRLKRRMVATGADSLDTYLKHLDQQPEEYQRLISIFLIKVTEFFRDKKLFDALRYEILPRLIEEARGRSRELRIWSAGCATGEEAYSIAALVAEALGEELEQFSVRIFATDLDAQAISFARRGIYPSSALTGAPAELVDRYFTKVDGNYEVQKRIRSLVVFGQHDLGGRAPFPHIDLVLCRNVLIYFGPDLQRRALQLFAYSLRNGGILALGKAETISPLSDYFIPINALLRIYRRQGEQLLIPAEQIQAAAPPQSKPLVSSRPSALSRLSKGEPSSARTRTSTDRLGDTMLGLPIGIAIVDRRYDIQTINAAALRLLGILRPAVGEDILHLAEGVSQKALRSVIDAAFRNLSKDELDAVLTVDSGVGEQLTIHVRAHRQYSQHDAGVVESVALEISEISPHLHEALAREWTNQQEATQSGVGRDEPQGAEETTLRQQQEIEQLRSEAHKLMMANRELREANADLTTTNLDLRQSNEEFLVTTEELQASSEEVETLNEELQARNEELETLNEDMQATVEELNTSNDDMESRSHELQELASDLDTQRRTSEAERLRLEAILVNMGDAVLVIDAAGELVLTNAAYARMFGGEKATFTPEDERGRPLAPETLPQRRTARGESCSMEFTLPGPYGDLRWFEANGQPLISDNKVQGGVIIIRDITDRSLRRLQNEFLAQAAHELRTPLTSVQAALQLVMERGSRWSQQSIERNLSIAVTQVRRLGALVSDLVDVARLQNGKLNLQFAPINVADMTREAVNALQLSIAQRIELTVQDDILIVRGNALRIEQVIDNILMNAAKYAPHTDHIDVQVRRNSEYVEIVIQDEGPGMEELEASRLFSRFYQAAQSDNTTHGGLGLGLFITHELVIAHGGDISVETAPGVGSTFIVRLPLLSEAAQSEA